MYDDASFQAIALLTLNTVTIGTEFVCSDAIPVNSIIQKNMFTGAHPFTTSHVRGGYVSITFECLQPSTRITATIAWKTTNRVFKSPWSSK